MNNSPWIRELDTHRQTESLKTDIQAEICIVGAGVAGLATAFFILENTDKKIVMLEKGVLASGATGHNAGLLYAGFERPFYELVDEFGPDMAKAGQEEYEQAWGLLEHMIMKAGISIPFYRFVGHGGLRSQESLMIEIRETDAKRKIGLPGEPVLVAKHCSFLASIPKEYAGSYELKEGKELLDILGTNNESYIAVTSHQYGVLNAALLCEKLLQYFLSKYPDRFALYENTSVAKAVLQPQAALLDVGEHVLTAEQVILCTNGFENIRIFSASGLALDTAFHETVNGKVGYMWAFLEDRETVPGGTWYEMPEMGLNNSNEGLHALAPFLYISRRPFEYQKGKFLTMTCIGGPEFRLADKAVYNPAEETPEEARQKIEGLIESMVGVDLKPTGPADFSWHGLMGYTPNGVRVVGSDKKEPALFYNLGCNGVGLLPGIAGGNRIAKILNRETLAPSIFDPK